MSALSGRRIVVTRPRPAADEFARQLAARGADPVVFPTIEVRSGDPVDAIRAAVDRLVAGDWVVLTSANAGEIVAPCLAGLSGGGVRIAAVGAATARALVRRGIAVDAMPNEALGAAIAGALGDLRGRRVLVPRSASGREETLAALRDAGAEVHVLEVYHLEPGAPGPTALAAVRGGFDAIVFTSPSTIRGFLDLAGPEAAGLLRSSAVVCIGPTTAAEARSIGALAPIVADSATSEGMLAALEHHFATAPAAPERRS